MRRLRLLLGLAMALLGVLLLLEQAGWVLGAVVGRLFWFLLLLGALLILLLGGRRRAAPADPSPAAHRPVGDRRSGELVAIPLSAALKAELTITAPLGRLTIQAGEAGDDLLTGRFLAPVTADARLSGTTLHATLAPAPDAAASRVDWTIALQPDVPLTLHVTTGSGQARLNLSRLDVVALTLTTGVGRCDVTLPARPGHLALTLHSGTGGVQLRPAAPTSLTAAGAVERLRTPPDTPLIADAANALPRHVTLQLAAATGAVRWLPAA